MNKENQNNKQHKRVTVDDMAKDIRTMLYFMLSNIGHFISTASDDVLLEYQRTCETCGRVHYSKAEQRATIESCATVEEARDTLDQMKDARCDAGEDDEE